MVILMSRYRDNGMSELGTDPQKIRYSRAYKSFETFKRYNMRGLLPGKYFVEIWYSADNFYREPSKTFDYTIPGGIA